MPGKVSGGRERLEPTSLTVLALSPSLRVFQAPRVPLGLQEKR